MNNKAWRRIYLGILLVLFFLLFDRSGALLFREMHFHLYSGVKVRKSVFGKREIIKKGFYDTLIFGSSRTAAAIHPLYLYNHLGLKAYRMAKSDRYPHYYYLVYRNFKNRFGKPKYLIYGVDYFMFNMKTSKFLLMSASMKRRRVRKIDILKKPPAAPALLGEVSFLLRWKRKLDRTISDILYKYALELDRPAESGINAAGISRFTGNKVTVKSSSLIQPDRWEKFPYIHSDHGEGDYLKRLFDELEGDGVSVFLVDIPDFIGTYESKSEKTRFLKDIRSLIRGRKNFYFLHYNHPEKFDLSNPRYFKDGKYGEENSHMSYYGSIPFNRMLAEDLKRYIRPADYRQKSE